MPGDTTENRELAYTPGRFAIALADALGTRDPIALRFHAKTLREGMERVGHTPALMLIVVADDEREAAVDLIRTTLEKG
jgi:hypothetical protein